MRRLFIFCKKWVSINKQQYFHFILCYRRLFFFWFVDIVIIVINLRLATVSANAKVQPWFAIERPPSQEANARRVHRRVHVGCPLGPSANCAQSRHASGKSLTHTSLSTSYFFHKSNELLFLCTHCCTFVFYWRWIFLKQLNCIKLSCYINNLFLFFFIAKPWSVL